MAVSVQLSLVEQSGPQAFIPGATTVLARADLGRARGLYPPFPHIGSYSLIGSRRPRLARLTCGHDPEAHVDEAPATAYAKPLDGGTYLGSSTMYGQQAKGLEAIGHRGTPPLQVSLEAPGSDLRRCHEATQRAHQPLAPARAGATIHPVTGGSDARPGASAAATAPSHWRTRPVSWVGAQRRHAMTGSLGVERLAPPEVGARRRAACAQHTPVG